MSNQGYEARKARMLKIGITDGRSHARHHYERSLAGNKRALDFKRRQDAGMSLQALAVSEGISVSRVRYILQKAQSLIGE